ncbi:ChaN family lipoprotein [Terrimonas sp. NA20]|uniref:ChaN family lipoprotein n=1 Tax=Terrimonas ginsenosidimutans TaxID=2908004 RepID=A0ABS9KWX2_9BACT|nr:ChaN family lipoprotein [Terrimonas ginsenosidimutans]MCG2616742.1 ChaN family lipoprotein [Terrimonas ginsenosidimutans]
MIKTFLTLILIITFYHTSRSQTPWSDHYKIYDTKNKKTISITDLVGSVKEADVLFFGEEHNDSIAHRLQDTLYRSLLNQYGTVTLSMEMFERDCQLVLDEYLQSFITDERLVKEGRAWNNYKDYRPIVNTAKERQQKVIAANAPRRYVNMTSRKGLKSIDSLSKNAKTYFAKLPLDTINAPYQEKFSKIMGGRQTSSNVYYAQTMWDATMAESIYKYWKKNRNTKVFHLNGRFHTDDQLGTFTQLQRSNKKIKIQNISCFPATDFNNPQWSQYESLGDYVIITNPDIARTF